MLARNSFQVLQDSIWGEERLLFLQHFSEMENEIIIIFNLNDLGMMRMLWDFISLPMTSFIYHEVFQLLNTLSHQTNLKKMLSGFQFRAPENYSEWSQKEIGNHEIRRRRRNVKVIIIFPGIFLLYNLRVKYIKIPICLSYFSYFRNDFIL